MTAIGPADLPAIPNGYIHHYRARNSHSSFVKDAVRDTGALASHRSHLIL